MDSDFPFVPLDFFNTLVIFPSHHINISWTFQSEITKENKHFVYSNTITKHWVIKNISVTNTRSRAHSPHVHCDGCYTSEWTDTSLHGRCGDDGGAALGFCSPTTQRPRSRRNVTHHLALTVSKRNPLSIYFISVY